MNSSLQTAAGYLPTFMQEFAVNFRRRMAEATSQGIRELNAYRFDRRTFEFFAPPESSMTERARHVLRFLTEAGYQVKVMPCGPSTDKGWGMFVRVPSQNRSDFVCKFEQTLAKEIEQARRFGYEVVCVFVFDVDSAKRTIAEIVSNESPSCANLTEEARWALEVLRQNDLSFRIGKVGERSVNWGILVDLTK